MTGKNDLSLYIHIPFCRAKCPYCHFYSIPCSEERMDLYLQSLLLEIQLRKEEILKGNLISIYLGGGTPFLFSPRRMAKVFAALAAFLPFADLEITLEANPEFVSYEDLLAYSALGVNRLSFGAQSFNAKELAFLQRGHSPDDVMKALTFALQAGISNLSIDLMYELPHQTLENWRHSLQIACSLPITHLSLYNFMIESPSAFFHKKERLEKEMPPEELSLEMYTDLLEETEKHGFLQYEISAFAKKGYESKHNVGYWQGREFLGFGPAAFSFYNGKRFSNVSNLLTYCTEIEKQNLPIDFVDNVTFLERRKELLAVGLRMTSGLDLKEFEKRFGALEESTFSSLLWLENLGLLERNGNSLKLTRKGFLVYDKIAEEII